MTAAQLELPPTDTTGDTATAKGDEEAPTAVAVPRVLGIDISLNSTGYATTRRTWTHRPTTRGVTRLREIRAAAVDACITERPDLVVIEGPSFGSVQRSIREMGAAWWFVVDGLVDHWHLMELPPSSLKKYATGSGNAKKADMVRELAHRAPHFAGGEDEADALWLCLAGRELLGQPVVRLPQGQTQAAGKATVISR